MIKVLVESEITNNFEFCVDSIDEIHEETLPSDAWIWVDCGVGFIELCELYRF